MFEQKYAVMVWGREVRSSSWADRLCGDRRESTREQCLAFRDAVLYLLISAVGLAHFHDILDILDAADCLIAAPPPSCHFHPEDSVSHP